MKAIKKRMITVNRGTANDPLNFRDLFKMINAMADAIEELQNEVNKVKNKDTK